MGVRDALIGIAIFLGVLSACQREEAPRADASTIASSPQTKPPFDHSRDLTILAFDGDRQILQAEPGRRYRLVSQGLEKVGLPEIEIPDVPYDAARSAAMLINLVADYQANQARIGSGQTWAQEFDQALVVVRCFEGDRGGRPVLRLVDAENTKGDPGPPLMALATVLYIQAMQKLEGQGDRDTALAELKKAVELYPGDQAARQYQFPRPLVNQGNHLSYLTLSNEESEKVSWYRAALERSDLVLQYELGCAELPDRSREELVRDAARLVRAAQQAKGAAPWGEAKLQEAEASVGAGIMALLPSPIPYPDGRVMNVGPVPFRRYFYEQPVAARLLDQDIGELAADIYRQHRRQPIELLVLLRETRWIYLGPVDPYAVHGVPARSRDAPPRAPLNSDYQAQDKTLGSIVADIGRKLAAGLTPMEIRAVFKLTREPSQVAGAQRKLAKFAEQEERWYAAAIAKGP